MDSLANRHLCYPWLLKSQVQGKRRSSNRSLFLIPCIPGSGESAVLHYALPEKLIEAEVAIELLE